jgi:hypothetical protein
MNFPGQDAEAVSPTGMLTPLQEVPQQQQGRRRKTLLSVAIVARSVRRPNERVGETPNDDYPPNWLATDA